MLSVKISHEDQADRPTQKLHLSAPHILPDKIAVLHITTQQRYTHKVTHPLVAEYNWS